MGKKFIFMLSTVLLFIIVDAMALFVWNSWYLYCGAVLTGHVALTLLTVILNRTFNIETLSSSELINNKSCFYILVANSYGKMGMINIILLIIMFMIVPTAACISFMILNIVFSVAALLIALYWCERKEWRFWLSKALFL